MDTTETVVTELDREIVELAVESARAKMASSGCTPETAARLACPGAWQQFRHVVLGKLIAEKGND